MNLVELSQRIKARRQHLGLTLEQLARRTGLTRSVLSKVENFRVTPSLTALGRIAKSLQISLSELLDEIEQDTEVLVVRKGEGTIVQRDEPDTQIVYEALANQRDAKAMNPFLLMVPPGDVRKEALPHEGEEFLMVIAGDVNLEFSGQMINLHQGDSAYFDATTPHRLQNPMQENAIVLCVFCPRG